MVKDEDVGTWDVSLGCCFEGVGKKFGLDDESAYLGCAKCMIQFVWCVGGINAGEYAAEGEDAKEGHRVVYL
jgi:hypothetical protein